MYGAYGLYRLFRHGGVKSDDSGDLSHDDGEDYHEKEIPEIPAPTMKFSNTKSLHDEDDD